MKTKRRDGVNGQQIGLKRKENGDTDTAVSTAVRLVQLPLRERS